MTVHNHGSNPMTENTEMLLSVDALAQEIRRVDGDRRTCVNCGHRGYFKRCHRCGTAITKGKRSEEFREEISRRMKALWNDPAWRKRMVASLKERSKNKEYRALLSRVRREKHEAVEAETRVRAIESAKRLNEIAKSLAKKGG